MTKARDLAGFASSSVTTTASDGLVLKGDGSSTDVVIKNGANATVATVADGTTTLAATANLTAGGSIAATANLTAGGSITATGASVGALAQGAIQVGNSSGVAAPLTIGSNAQLLQSNGTTAAWATISTGATEVVFPSDWASPTNTYSTSGTWSKGSLADNDYVWVYLLGGGGGGGTALSSNSYRSAGGGGGPAFLIYAKASILDGASYVIGAGAAGTSTTHNATVGSATTFTITESNGGTVFSTANSSTSLGANIGLPTGGAKDTISLTGLNDYVLNALTTDSINFTDTVPTGAYAYPFLSLGSQISTVPADFATHHIFAAGGGGGKSNQSSSGIAGNSSQFAGDGGDGSSTASATQGTYPGGGGGGTMQSLVGGGDGANGNMRVYHV